MRRRRAGQAFAAAALLLTGGLLAATPAVAAACSGSRGVTVVVDNGSSISTRCASGDPSSAKAALQAAGFSTTDVQTQPGFLCRVNGFPASDPCVRTPSATAYWAFFSAHRGGSWAYSTLGYAGYDPAPGTVVGFRFGSGQAPRLAPPAATVLTTPVPTPTVKPKPTPTPVKTLPTTAPQGSTSEATRTTTAPRSATASPTASASTSRSATVPPPATTASSVPTDSPSSAPTDDVVAAPPVTPGSGAGPALMGAGLVVLVGAAGAYAVWRRRLP